MNRVTSIVSSYHDSSCFADALDKLGEDFNHTTINSSDHGVSMTELEKKINDTNPEIVIFWGDSEANNISLTLKKKGCITMVHAGAGVRSGDRSSSEEINRAVCDLCSDYHFVYHDYYGRNLLKENFNKKSIFVVGNPTYKANKEAHEVATKNKTPVWYKKRIALNISNSQNIYNTERLNNLISFAYFCEQEFGVQVTFFNSAEALNETQKVNLNLPFSGEHRVFDDHVDLAQVIAQSVFVISDSDMVFYQACCSGAPVVIPSDHPTQPTSINSSCCSYVSINDLFHPSWKKSLDWVEKTKLNLDWLVNEEASQNISDSLKIILEEKGNNGLRI